MIISHSSSSRFCDFSAPASILSRRRSYKHNPPLLHKLQLFIHCFFLSFGFFQRFPLFRHITHSSSSKGELKFCLNMSTKVRASRVYISAVWGGFLRWRKDAKLIHRRVFMLQRHEMRKWEIWSEILQQKKKEKKQQPATLDVDDDDDTSQKPEGNFP